MKFFFDYERPELAEILQPAFRATQIYKSVYQRWFDDFELMTDLPKALRSELAGEWDIKLPSVHRRFDSRDGTRRYLVRLADSEFAETVFIPEEHRSTICISSQVGCALACTFCLTGQLGLTRNLSVPEIVSQVELLARETTQRFSVVFMGMREPFDNYDNVLHAIRILHHAQGLKVPMT